MAMLAGGGACASATLAMTSPTPRSHTQVNTIPLRLIVRPPLLRGALSRRCGPRERQFHALLQVCQDDRCLEDREDQSLVFGRPSPRSDERNQGDDPDMGEYGP